MPPQPVKTRRDLFDLLEQQMNRTFHRGLDSGFLLSRSKLLKSFVFEFDWDPEALDTPESRFLARELSLPATKNSQAARPTVTETHEHGFYIVQWPYPKRHPVRIYLDTSSDPDRRFWLAYSLSDAAALDRAVDRLMRGSASFDRVWFWPELLRGTQSKGEFRGVGVDYDYRRFERTQGNIDSTNYLKVQLWGGPETQRVYEYVSAQEEFRGRIVLGKVRMKYWSDTQRRDSFVIEDIKYNGKFLARGTSFESHQSLLTELRREYATRIRSIEDRHIIRWADVNERTEIEGDPVFFELNEHPIEDLDKFCQVVFSGHAPFRLWGIPREDSVGEECRYVSAVDVHTGSKLFFEVYHHVICMYLYPGACGNTVARFYTNLQHTFSRLVVGKDNEGVSLF